MECPKCKDQFVVAKPAMKADSDSGEKAAVARPKSSSANGSAKSRGGETYDVVDDEQPVKKKTTGIKSKAPWPTVPSKRLR